MASRQIELRDYQQSLIKGFYEEIRSGNNRTLAVAVMGAGKTITAASVIKDCVAKNKKAMFLVHLNCLIEQTTKTLGDLGIPCTVLQGDRPYDPTAPVIVAMLPTLQARLKKQSMEELLGLDQGSLLNPPKPLGVIILDEAHETAYDKAYCAIDQAFPHVPVLGLTATPWRLKRSQYLGEHFKTAIVPLQPPDVIARGCAVPCRGYTIGGVLDLDEVGTGSDGDYKEGQMAQQASSPEALAFVVSQYQKLCSGEKFMMVGATVEQALATEQAFKAAGIPCETIVGEVSQKERQAIFERVKSGESMGICSVGCLTAGFDMPCLTAILFVRATKSRALFHQVAGRGSRPFRGKIQYKLLDFGGNLARHGNPMGLQDYRIEPKKPGDPAPQKQCPQCETWTFTFAKVCPCCGYLFPIDPNKPEPDLFFEDLGEFLDKVDRRKVKLLRKWRKEAWVGRTSPDVPADKFHREFGHIPPLDWNLNACLGRRTSSATRHQFLEYLRRHAPQRNADRWLQHHLAAEFGQQAPQFTPWWQVLGVEATASPEACQEAYRAQYIKLVDLYPPEFLESATLELNGALAASQESSLFRRAA